MPNGVECYDECVHVKSNNNESTEGEEVLTKDKVIDSPMLEINISDPSNNKPFNESDISSSKKPLSPLSTSTANNSFKSKEKWKCVSIKIADYERCTFYEAIVNRIEDTTHDQEDFSWCTSKISRRFIGLEMLFMPKISCVSATCFCVLILHSFLHQIGMKVDVESLAKMIPSKYTFRREIKKLAIDNLITLMPRTQGKK